MNNLEGSSFLFSLGLYLNWELKCRIGTDHATQTMFSCGIIQANQNIDIYITLHVVFPYSLENYNMHFHFHRERTSNSTVLFWQRILQTSKSTELIQLKQ